MKVAGPWRPMEHCSATGGTGSTRPAGGDFFSPQLYVSQVVPPSGASGASRVATRRHRLGQHIQKIGS